MFIHFNQSADTSRAHTPPSLLAVYSSWSVCCCSYTLLGQSFTRQDKRYSEVSDLQTSEKVTRSDSRGERKRWEVRQVVSGTNKADKTADCTVIRKMSITDYKWSTIQSTSTPPPSRGLGLTGCVPASNCMFAADFISNMMIITSSREGVKQPISNQPELRC